MDLLKDGQGVFGMTLGGRWQGVQALLRELPGEPAYGSAGGTT